MMGTNFRNDNKNKIDPKKNIRKVLKNYRNYSNSQTKFGKDLYEYIPGLYRLLDLCKDDGSNGLGMFLYNICEIEFHLNNVR